MEERIVLSKLTYDNLMYDSRVLSYIISGGDARFSTVKDECTGHISLCSRDEIIEKLKLDNQADLDYRNSIIQKKDDLIKTSKDAIRELDIFNISLKNSLDICELALKNYESKQVPTKSWWSKFKLF
jgi:hypothetical protein